MNPRKVGGLFPLNPKRVRFISPLSVSILFRCDCLILKSPLPPLYQRGESGISSFTKGESGTSSFTKGGIWNFPFFKGSLNLPPFLKRLDLSSPTSGDQGGF